MALKLEEKFSFSTNVRSKQSSQPPADFSYQLLMSRKVWDSGTCIMQRTCYLLFSLTPPLKLSPGKDILYFTEELVSYVGSVGKVQVKGLHPEQMSLCCTSRGKWEGVSWNRDHCANSHRKGSSGWGKASKSESPVWRDAVLVLRLVGLGLTHLSWKLLENNSGDTASRKDHWRRSSCSLIFPAQLWRQLV